MIDNLSIVVHVFSLHILILISVDEILLTKFVNGLTNLGGLPLNVKIIPFCLKYLNSVLFAFT